MRRLIARPTAQSAPGRRSIQMTISSRLPSSPTPWTTRSAKRVPAASGGTAQGYNRRVSTPGEHAALDRLRQIARLDPGLLLRVAADERGPFEDGVVELPGGDPVRARGADQSAGEQPFAAQYGVLRARDRHDDVLLGGVPVVLRRLGPEPLAEARETIGVPRVGDHALELRQRDAHAGELALRLPPRPDDPERASARLREMPRRYRAGRARPEL